MPEAFDLSKMDPILEKFRGQEGALIPVLQEAQGIYGYLPEEVLARISRELKIPLSRVYGVVTFYAQFYLTPRGRHTVRVCRGTACHVRGAPLIVTAVEDELKLKGDEDTTEDRLFTVEKIACFGACSLAPVMVVNSQTHGRMAPDKARRLIRKTAEGDHA